jgi:tetratricopeptide (TPR) repeat protein
LIASGQYDEAATRLREALLLHWEPGLADLLAEAELQAGRPGEAVRLLVEVVERAGPSVKTLTRLGAAQHKGGRPDVAAQVWTRAAGLGVGGAVRHLHYKLATYHEEKGATKEARRHYALAQHGRGHEAFWAGQFAVAQGALEKAIEYDPAMASSWFYLGEIHRLLRQTEPARKAYQRCLEINPEHGRAHAGLALLDARRE